MSAPRPRSHPTAAILLALGILAACEACVIGHEARYDFRMAGARHLEAERVVLDRAGTALAVADEHFGIEWRIKDFGIGVTVENRSGSPARARWSDAVFVDEAGQNRELVVDQPWSERHAESVSEIAPGESLRVSLFPRNWLQPFGDPEERRWTRTRGIFEVPGLRLEGEAEIAAKAAENVGKTVGVVLPLELESKLYEYVFSFTVEAVGTHAVRDVI